MLVQHLSAAANVSWGGSPSYAPPSMQKGSDASGIKADVCQTGARLNLFTDRH